MPRLSCSYYPRFGGVVTTIGIYDGAGGIFDPGIGMPGEDFCTRPEGAIVTQEGNTRDIYQAIQPSSASFDMLIENAAHESFLADLALAEDNRFYIKIDHGGFVDFIGSVVTDEVVQEDTRSSKSWITINATDGLPDLQNIPYSWEDGTAYVGRERLTVHMKKIFSHLPTYELYQNSSVYLFTSMFAAEMPDTSTSPLEQSWVDHSVFQKRSEDKITFLTCYEVLKLILDGFDLRMLTAGQHIYIYPWNLYGNPTKNINTWVYPSLDMTSGNEGMIHLDPIQACSDGIDAEAGGVKVWQSPARSVAVTYKHGAGENWLFGSRFIEVREITKCVEAGTIPTLTETTRFHFTANVRYFLSADRPLLTNGLRFITRATIRLGSNYYTREYDIIPFAPLTLADEAWEGVAGFYDIPCSELVSPWGADTAVEYNHSENFEILSQEIPESAYGQELEICFKLIIVDNQGTELDVTTYPSSINIENPVFNFVEKDNVLVENTANTVTVLNTVNNTRHFDRTLVFGDGPNPEANSRITVWQDGEHIDTTEWTDDHTGLGPYTHTELIARMMIARRIQTLRIKEGPFHEYTNKLEPVTYDGLIYMPLVTQWITKDNMTTGEWVSITLGEAAALEHTTLVEDDAKIAPGTPSRPNSGDIVSRPVRKSYVGPITEITPTVELGNILTLSEDEQASIVHLYRNGNRMNLESTASGIYDFKLYDNSGVKIKPAIPFTANDRIETLYYI